MLLRILGLGFGIAIIVGGAIGVGILRTPGEVAALLRSPALVVGIWAVGGVYARLGALSVSELGTMLPRAGGFYVYARRAFGDGAGLLVGVSDWLAHSAAAAFVSTVLAEYLAILWPPLAGHERALACAVIAGFALLNWGGLRASSAAIEWTTVIKGLAFAALIVACFAAAGPASGMAAARPRGLGLAAAYFVALESVIITYGGWYNAIYFAEEDRNPERNLPRAMIGGALVVIAVYLLLNFGYLRVLGAAGMAASSQPAADAVAVVAGAGAGRLITAISVVSLLVPANGLLMLTTRVLYGLSRDHLAPAALARTNPRGTPVSMWASAGAALLLASTGSYGLLLGMGSFLLVVIHSTSYLALLVLRRREPDAKRPFRVPLYPWLTLAALGGAGSYLAGAMVSDPRNSLIAVAAVAAGYPAWRLYGPKAHK